ncbi:hypothetical protein ACQYRI_18590 [Salmonella enterica]
MTNIEPVVTWINKTPAANFLKVSLHGLLACVRKITNCDKKHAKESKKFVCYFSQNYNPTYREWQKTGFVDRFGTTQEPALIVHSTLPIIGQEQHFIWYKGIMRDFKDDDGTLVQPPFLDAQGLLSVIKKDMGLDLRRDGNTGTKPLHLIADFSGGLASSTLAAKLAKAAERPVICYGHNQEITLNTDYPFSDNKHIKVYGYPLKDKKRLNKPLPQIIHMPQNSTGFIRNIKSG